MNLLNNIFILNNMPDSVIVTDINGTIIFANDNVIENTGYQRNEIIGQNPRIFSSNFHSKTFFDNMWKTILSGKVYKGEIRNKRKNGSVYWKYIEIHPFLDKDNYEKSRFVAYCREITDTRYKNMLFKAMIENSYDTHIVWDQDKTAVDVWPSSEKVLTSFYENLKGHTIEYMLNCSDCIIEQDTINKQNKLFQHVDNDPTKVYSDIFNIKHVESGTVIVMEVLMQRFNTVKYYQVIRNITSFMRSKLALVQLGDVLNNLQNTSYKIRSIAQRNLNREAKDVKDILK